MADEQAQAELTAVEETQEQTTVTEDAGSEAAQTPSEDTDKGDLRVPLKEERERRQRLEKSLSDPEFIYERARALGLAQGEEPELPVSSPAPNISAEVSKQIRIEKAKEKYPEIQTDDKLQLMISALIQGGLDPVDAADEVFSRMKKTEEKVKVEAANEARAEIGEREKAHMADGVRTNPEAERMSQIQKDMRSPIKATQEAATVEWLKEMNKKRGII